MNSRNLLGRNAYAKHRGCSPNAVRKAEQSGRIAAACIRDDQGVLVGIDARLADRLWLANTDPAMQRMPPRAHAEASPAPVVQTSGSEDGARHALLAAQVAEAGLLALPAALARAGLEPGAVDQVLDDVFRAMHGRDAEMCALQRSMIEDERHSPGAWT